MRPNLQMRALMRNYKIILCGHNSRAGCKAAKMTKKSQNFVILNGGSNNLLALQTRAAY